MKGHIFRRLSGRIDRVDEGQTEAAMSLACLEAKPASLVLPQACASSFHEGNEVISMLKTTSLVRP